MLGTAITLTDDLWFKNITLNLLEVIVVVEADTLIAIPDEMSERVEEENMCVEQERPWCFLCVLQKLEKGLMTYIFASQILFLFVEIHYNSIIYRI